MRLCVVTTSYPAFIGDPAGHFVEAEVRLHEEARDVVTVVRPRPGGAFGWPGVAARVRKKPWLALEAAAWSAMAIREVRAARPERVIAHWSMPSAAIVIGSKVTAPLEIVSHGGDVRLLAKLPKGERIVASFVERAERWRFVSESLLDELLRALPRALAARLTEKAVVMASPNDLLDVSDSIAVLRSEHGHRPLYVCAGRLVRSKRVDKVIDHVASMTTRTRSNAQLVVLGDGPERARLELLAARWGIDVRFLGTTTRHETLSWIGAADELLHASQAEGLSTVVREAEGLGVKVTLL